MHYLEAIAKAAELSQAKTVANVGAEEYYFTFVIFNDTNYLSLNYNAIKNISIQDNILNWYQTGTAVIDNTMFCIDSSKRPFQFTGGGADFLFIEIKPKVDDESKIVYPKKATIRNLFTIYDYQDKVQANSEKNTKQLFFRDFVHDNLKNFNSPWSTADGARRLYPELANIPISQLSNSDRSLFTGDAIEDFLNVATGGKDTLYAINKGKTKVFYCPPVGSTGIDTIDYLLKEHIHSDDGQPCILKHHLRGDKGPIWSLLRLGDIFNLATHDVKSDNGTTTKITGAISDERFTVSVGAGETGAKADDDVVIMTPYDSPFTIRATGKDTIGEFKLNRPNVDEQLKYLATSPVHSYNRRSGIFNIYCRDNNPFNYHAFFHNTFIRKMYVENNGSRVNRSVSPFVDSIFSGDDDNPYIGRNNSLLSEILFSNTIQFVLPGNIMRTSCKFVTLDPPADSRSNTHIGRLIYGQWLVTNLSHEFTQQGYNNTFLASKPYKYSA